MSYFKKSSWLGMLLALACTAACAKELSQQNIAIGTWARTQSECSKPELKITETQLNISIDADGTPTSFNYPNVNYSVNSQDITIRLNSRHPYSKTADKESLHFKIIDKNTISLQQLKNKQTQFVRCSN